MESEGPPSLPECSFQEEKCGLRLYSLKKTLLLNYEPKIKLMSIGKENDLETKSIILLGATGAGKTCLINAIVNHLLDVRFENNFRYILKDEIGDKPKSLAVSQTEYVVGYLIYVRPGSKWQYNYLIIDLPGFKDSRGELKDQEVTQQIRACLQDVDGVDELNLIGFVVNGTIARLQPQFNDIVNAFCEIFGENAKEIIRILVSFGHMNRPPVMEVLEASLLKGYKRIKFDNSALQECNKVNEEYSENEINVHRTFWNATSEVYDSLLNEVSNMNAISLSMTRETLEDIQMLNRFVGNLEECVNSYLSSMLKYKDCENKCSDLTTIITANEIYEGTVDVRKKYRIRLINWIQRTRIHAHNCEKCVQTCRYPCVHLLTDECPRPGKICGECPCPNENHVKSDEVINHTIEKRPVVHHDKKKLYDDAKSKQSEVQQEMVTLSEEIDGKKITVEDNVRLICEQSEKIKQNSLGTTIYCTLQSIKSTLNKVKMRKLEAVNESREMQAHVIPILDDLSEHLESIINPERP